MFEHIILCNNYDYLKYTVYGVMIFFLDAQAFQYGLVTRRTGNYVMCRGTEMTLASCRLTTQYYYYYYYYFGCQGDAGVQCLPIGEQAI